MELSISRTTKTGLKILGSIIAFIIAVKFLRYF